MKINKQDHHKYQISQNLMPLFNAMSSGMKIKKIICCSGLSQMENKEMDFVIEDFIAINFDYCYGEVKVNKEQKLIITNNEVLPHYNKSFFFMSWVRSFELYPCLELNDGTQIEMKQPEELFSI